MGGLDNGWRWRYVMGEKSGRWEKKKEEHDRKMQICREKSACHNVCRKEERWCEKHKAR